MTQPTSDLPLSHQSNPASPANPADPMAPGRPTPASANVPLASLESRFISAARFLMISGLVYHHLFEIPGSSLSPRLDLAASTHFLPEAINAFFHMAFMASVPLLSVISGYLFFRKPDLDFRRQLGRRVFTVALPTWLWSALWLALGWTLFTAGLNQGAWAWTNYGFENPGFGTVVNGVFGATTSPWAFQFWFVRDLILTLLLSPLIWFALRLLGGWVILAALPVWFLLPDPPVFFSGNVPLFFTVGAWLARPGGIGLHAALQAVSRAFWLLAPLFTAALLLRIMAHELPPLRETLGGYQFLCLLRILGVLSFIGLLLRLVEGQGALAGLLLRYSGYSFFLFAAHFPVIELYQVAVLQVPGHASTPGLLLSWALLPLLTIVSVVWVARVLERHAPRVFAVLNGGRSGSAHGARAPAGGAVKPGVALAS